jgi:Uma2 family endonuclease
MGMPQTVQDWTAERVRNLPDDGRRYEVVDGELFVTPAPNVLHQRTLGNLWRALDPYVRAHLRAEVLTSPADVELDPRTLVQPDMFVAPFVPGPAPRRIKSWREMGTMLLAIEILSPSTARADRQVKRRRYQRAGIAEYWIVDLDARLVERWRPGDDRPEMAADTLAWQPDPPTPPLVIDLAALFADVHA